MGCGRHSSQPSVRVRTMRNESVRQQLREIEIQNDPTPRRPRPVFVSIYFLRQSTQKQVRLASGRHRSSRLHASNCAQACTPALTRSDAVSHADLAGRPLHAKPVWALVKGNATVAPPWHHRSVSE
jgi:hypothetical protein